METKELSQRGKFWVNIAINVLTTVVTILVVIPGEQGESLLQMAIQALKALLGG